MNISIMESRRECDPWHCTVSLNEEEKNKIMEMYAKEGTQALNLLCETVGNEIIRLSLAAMVDYMLRKGGEYNGRKEESTGTDHEPTTSEVREDPGNV